MNKPILNKPIIEAYLAKRKMTKKALASLIWITPEHLSRLLSGRFSPGKVTTRMITLYIKKPFIGETR